MFTVGVGGCPDSFSKHLKVHSCTSIHIQSPLFVFLKQQHATTGNLHINGMMNEECYLVLAGYLPASYTVNWGGSALFDCNYPSVEKRRKEQRAGWGSVSKGQLAKLAVFPWTPGTSGVPACFWKWQPAPVGLI